ncbi:hypothetical protein BDR07DRAFT_1424355, partial [Suillus spraguei]
MARKHDWDHALQDARKSLSIKPSLTGYISKGIALCGKGHIRHARAAFDVASMYTDKDSQTTHFLLLIKSIALFGANQHDEAILLLEELTTGCPNADTQTCDVVHAYLRVQLGMKASDGTRHNEAAEHFTAAVNCSALSSKSDIHHIYEDLVVNRCNALLQAGRLQDAVKSYQFMMDTTDDITKANCLDWSKDFTEQCRTLCLTSGDAALAASDLDGAIDLYSAVINLNCTSDIVFANRSKAKLGKMLWEDALQDAQKVIELKPSSHVGYQLTHAALHGAQRFDKAMDAFTIMLSKLDNAPEAHIRDLSRQYVRPSQVEDAIQRAVWTELEYSPLRLLNTSTGLLCDRAAQISTFKTSAEYKELLSSVTKHSDLRNGAHQRRGGDVLPLRPAITQVGRKEVLLHDIQDKVVYELNGLGGIAKLQSFCKVARDAGYRWAWMDTCCIDKRSNTEVQNRTYHRLPMRCPPSSARCTGEEFWNERGWTFQEFVAPKVVIFYQNDWSLYLGDRSPNHKESPAIMRNARALVTFRPGMSGASEKLQWASKRVTTVQEDCILYWCLWNQLYLSFMGEKQRALGRLLQEILSSSSYHLLYTPPRTPPSLSQDHLYTQFSSLRQTVSTDLALKLYGRLEQLRAPRFAKLQTSSALYFISMSEVRERRGTSHLLITTEETLVQFSRNSPFGKTFLLVRPWNRDLLRVPDFAEPNFTEQYDDLTSLTGGSPAEEERGSRALRLMVRLGQPFDAFLLAQQHVGEYERDC